MPRKPPKDDGVYLLDMLRAAEAIVAFTQGTTLEQYESNALIRSAVERQIEIIGEAARKVSAGFQKAHPEIQWRGIIAQRHVLAHEYGEILDSRIYRVATVHVPALIVQLRTLIPR